LQVLMILVILSGLLAHASRRSLLDWSEKSLGRTRLHHGRPNALLGFESMGLGLFFDRR
jgi:hypothetical protein